MPEAFETDIERTAGATDGFAIHRFPDYLAGVPSGVCVMRRSPSIASALPDDVDVYLVLDDFGKSGRSWREIDEEQTDRETIITDLMRGEFNSPVRVVAFNTAEGWSRDVSEDIAEEILQRFNAQAEYHSEHLEAFLDRRAAGKPLQLPLPI
jgi:hypothetical protein